MCDGAVDRFYVAEINVRIALSNRNWRTAITEQIVREEARYDLGKWADCLGWPSLDDWNSRSHRFTVQLYQPSEENCSNINQRASHRPFVVYHLNSDQVQRTPSLSFIWVGSAVLEIFV
jgi:hypothetical protein